MLQVNDLLLDIKAGQSQMPEDRSLFIRETQDGEIGFRVEFDNRNGAHINVWNGKEKGPHILFNGSKKQ